MSQIVGLKIKDTHYAYSKFAAELEVWRGAQEGLNVVIVNPGVIIDIILAVKVVALYSRE